MISLGSTTADGRTPTATPAIATLCTTWGWEAQPAVVQEPTGPMGLAAAVDVEAAEVRPYCR